MDIIIAFLAGLWIGAIVGMVIMALCVVSGREDREREERASERDH